MKTLLVLSVAMLANACGDNHDTAAKKPKSNDTVFKPYVRAVDKAKAVSKTMDAAVKKQKDYIDAHTH